MNRVMWASLWPFNKYLLVLHKFELGDTISTIGFDRTPFWIQIHSLPMRMQTNEVVEKIVVWPIRGAREGGNRGQRFQHGEIPTATGLYNRRHIKASMQREIG